jgi:hypothetical protein
MRVQGQIGVLSLVGAVAFLVPACDSDDGDSNSNDQGGSAGAAGHSTAGSNNSAGHTNTAGQGGDAGNGGGGAGGASECGRLDEASGVVTCGEVKYRARVGTGCLYSPGDKEPAGGAGGGGGASGGAGASPGGAAGTDSGCDPDKCTEKPRGYCEAEAPGASGAGPVSCHYGCVTDSECGASEICVCGDPTYGGRCVQAFCKTDADCANGNRCGSSTACDQFSCNDDPACAVH